MLTYEPLEKYLLQQPGQTIAMSFADVERVIGHKLPPSAHKRNEWWSNNATNHSQAKAWLNAGFETANLDRKAKKVVFRRVARSGVRARNAGGDSHVQTGSNVHAARGRRSIATQPSVR